jgi:hypothetical protein
MVNTRLPETVQYELGLMSLTGHDILISWRRIFIVTILVPSECLCSNA